MRSSGKRALVVAVVATLALAVGASTVSAAPARSTKQERVQFDPVSIVLVPLLKGVISKLAGEAFGRMLTSLGVGVDHSNGIALARIQESLDRANTQLTTLRAESAKIHQQVLTSDFNNAAREAQFIVAHVDHAVGLLLEAARYPAGSADQKAVAREASSYIHAQLLGRAQMLNRIVNGNGPASPTSLLAAAYHVRTADHFLTHDDSVQVRYLIDYYATYETLAAVLAADYYRSTDFPEATIVRQLQETEAGVTRLLDSRREVVPSGMVVDVRTYPNLGSMGALLWITRWGGNTVNPALEYGPQFRGLLVPHHLPDPWYIPSRSELEFLISGWSGASPADWLGRQGEFSMTDLLKGQPAVFWTDDFAHGNKVYREQLVQESSPWWECLPPYEQSRAKDLTGARATLASNWRALPTTTFWAVNLDTGKTVEHNAYLDILKSCYGSKVPAPRYMMFRHVKRSAYLPAS